MDFEWDDDKNSENRRKHGIDFSEAVRVFDHPDLNIDMYDEAHSWTEERFITLGPLRNDLVLVVWTERMGDVIRVISARWATGSERAVYRRRMEQRR